MYIIHYVHICLYFLSIQMDIGQLEGAFVMGLGLWTSEELKYHPETGDLLTKNTWVNTKHYSYLD